MIFSVDLDSTLNNLMYAWLDYTNSKTRVNLKISDITMYNDPILLENIKFLENKNLYQESIDILPGAKQFIESLKKIGTVRIVSVTPPNHFRSKKEFVKTNFKDTELIMVRDSKLNIIKNTFVIDDKLSTLREHRDLNNGIGAVFTNDEYMYNNTDEFLCSGYTTILNYIQKLDKE